MAQYIAQHLASSEWLYEPRQKIIRKGKNYMPKTKKRTNVKSLSKTAKNLTSEQAKRVKGGLVSSPGGVNVAMADGSVRNISDGTSNTLLTAEKK